MIAYMIKEEDRDAVILITGSARQGKSNLAVQVARKVMKLIGSTFSLKEDIYYTKAHRALSELETVENKAKIFDEGYFSGMNLDAMNPEVKELVEVVSAVGSNHNLIIFNFQAQKRATKVLLERSNIWLHKPSRYKAILNAHQNVYITDDMWGVKKIEKSNNPDQINYFLYHNPNYITSLRTYKLPKSIEDQYKIYKKEAQLHDAKDRDERQKALNIDMVLLEELYVAQNQINPKFNVVEVQQYLMKNYDLPRKVAKKYEEQYHLYLARKKIEKSMRVANEEEVITISEDEK